LRGLIVFSVNVDTPLINGGMDHDQGSLASRGRNLRRGTSQSPRIARLNKNSKGRRSNTRLMGWLNVQRRGGVKYCLFRNEVGKTAWDDD